MNVTTRHDSEVLEGESKLHSRCIIRLPGIFLVAIAKFYGR